MDVLAYRIVVAGVVVVCTLSVLGLIVASYYTPAPPVALVSIANTCIGLLGGLLVPTPKGK